MKAIKLVKAQSDAKVKSSESGAKAVVTKAASEIKEANRKTASWAKKAKSATSLLKKTLAK